MEKEYKQATEEEGFPTPVGIGSVIDNRYEIVARLGGGGMGTVFRATQIELSREVAVKILHPRFTSDPSAIKRFQQEAQILSTLRHRNILAIFGFGAVDGFVYLALEFVRGESLASYLQRKGRLGADLAIPLLAQICDAMAYAHMRGILHRDLKPDNVLMTAAEATLAEAKVADFGLAKLLSGNGQKLTRTSEVVGDPRYMSPEQCSGVKLDERSDVYSFGCLMYEVLTGNLPFDAADPVAIMYKHIEATPAPFSPDLRLPPALESIAFTAMSKDPADRYQSFTEVAALLRRVETEPELVLSPPPLKHQQSHKPAKLTIKRATIALICTLTLISIGVYQRENLSLLYYQALQHNSDKRERVLATFGLARVLEQNGQLGAAQAELEHAVAIAKDDASLSLDAKEKAAEFLLRTKNQAAAANTYAELVADLEKQVYVENSSANYERISDACCKLIQLNPVLGYQSVFRLTSWYRSHGSLSEAEKLLLSAIAVGPRDQRATALFHLGTLELARRNEKLACADFDHALETAETRNCRLFLAHSSAAALHENGMYEAAMKYYLATAAGASEKSYLRYARLLFQTGDCYALLSQKEAASQQYRKAIAIWQSSPNQLDKELLPVALERLGKLDAVIEKRQTR